MLKNIFKHSIYILMVSFILLMLSACSSSNSGIKTIKPYKGSIQQSFTELARTKLNKIYDIDMPLSGDLARIQLQPGDNVKKGQVVSYLVQLPVQQAVRESFASLKLVEALYKNQLLTLHRQHQLKRSGFVSQSTFDQTVSYAKAYRAQIEKDKANLIVARYNLKRSVLRSPINGVILNRYTEGQKWIAVGTPLLQIGNLDKLEVVSDVLSQRAQQLHIGDPVLLSSEGSAKTLKGVIKRIDPAGFTKKSALGVDEQRVEVTIRLLNPKKAHIGVGYRLQAEFFIGSQEKNALIVPRFSVLQNNQGNYYVFKVHNKTLKKQMVTLGIQTDTKVSIVQGLTSHDSIAAQPSADM